LGGSLRHFVEPAPPPEPVWLAPTIPRKDSPSNAEFAPSHGTPSADPPDMPIHPIKVLRLILMKLSRILSSFGC